MEIWKEIYFIENGVEYDYREMYAISNYGRVKSLSRPIWNGYCYVESKEKALKTIKRKDDYKGISLNKNGKRKYFLIHRLVAHMFLSDFYFDGADIDHIDTDRTNNHVSNLCWCTRKENCNNPLTRKHKSDSKKGEKNSFYGKQHSEETKQKISKTKKANLNGG